MRVGRLTAAVVALLATHAWAEPAENPRESGNPAPTAPNTAELEDRRPHAIQVGRFETPWEALEVEARFRDQQVVRSEAYKTDSGKVRYRVVLGVFDGLSAAEGFIQNEKLQEAYPLPWSDPAGIRQVEVTLNCRSHDSDPTSDSAEESIAGIADQRKILHERKARIVIDESAKDRSGELALSWSCQAPPDRSPAAVHQKSVAEVGPAPEILIAPYLAIDTLSADGAGFSRLGYGLELGAYRQMGPLGVLVETEVFREGGVKGTGFSRPPHSLQATLRAGATLEPFDGWKFQPMAGIDRIPFVREVGGEDPLFSHYILPIGGMRLQARLVRFKKGTDLNLEGAYFHQFSARHEGLTIDSGSQIRIGFGTRSYFNEASSAEWTVQYRLTSRGTSDVSRQNSSAFFLGLRFHWDLAR